MALLLLESSRDEMLKPFYEMVVRNGNEISFGRFKGILLEHLTNFGGLKNLSLASNYYLAGAARYYFNGDLTHNKDLALFYDYQLGRESETESNNHKDDWDEEVCTRLNALILILRNAYIDTVGTSFEQPEDFGKMSLPKLLKKYKAKIDKLLFGEKKKEEEKSKYSTNVGNDYTFDIIYNQEECKKYYNATAPGAWCISYSQTNYNAYIRSINIHYVIFRKNGWENIKRVPNKDMWVIENGMKKPQDEYGNSLIALLQSNVDGQPVYITSRWNHGSSDCGIVEADHAYSKEEFMRITGTSEDDLMRIFGIWKEFREKKKKSPLKSELIDTIRKLKEAQIRINGGEDPKKTFGTYQGVVGNGDNLRKGLFKCFYRNSDNGKLYFCLVDNGKICFESTFEVPSFFVEEKRSVFQDMYVFYDSKLSYHIIYNYRKHKILEVDGTTKFREVPLDTSLRGESHGEVLFYSVKKSKNDIALLDCKTDIPITLPNGEVWSASIVDDRNEPYKINTATVYSKKYGIELEMIYDLSSNERYFFNIETREFFTPPPLTITPQLDEKFETKNWIPFISKVEGLNNFFCPVSLFCIEYKNPKKALNYGYDRNSHESPLYLYEKSGVPFNILGNNAFRFIRCYEGRVLIFKKVHPNKDGSGLSVDDNCSFYDMKNGNVEEMVGIKASPRYCGVVRYLNTEYLYCTYNYWHYIYNLDKKELACSFSNKGYAMDVEEVQHEIMKYMHNGPRIETRRIDNDNI